MNESMKVRETNNSHSEFSLRDGPNEELFSESIYCARICCDGGIVVCDYAGNLAKYSKEGEFEWRIGEEPLQGVTFIRKFFVDSSGLIYLPEKQKVKVYLPNGAFSHDIELESDSDSIGIAVMLTSSVSYVSS